MRIVESVFASAVMSVLMSCSEPVSTENGPNAEAGVVDLRGSVEAAVANASDLPSNLVVQVEDGVVLISGNLQCEECGGMRTPGNTGTIQQTLGSVVRAVPGVNDVQFDLNYSQ